MVPPHAAQTYPAEWQISIDKMYHGLIDTSGSGHGSVNDHPLGFPGLYEDV